MLRVLRTVSFRVFAGSLLLLLLAFGLFATSAIRVTTQELTRQAVADADRLGDVVAASTRYSMLLNRKQDVYQMIRTLGTQPGVLGIRVINKRGRITFSTDSTEAGHLVDLTADACVSCHDRSRPLEALPNASRARVYRDASGDRVVGVIHPVRNEPSCSAGGCHLSPAERTVLGVLDVRMSMRAVDASIATAQRRTAAWALGGFLLVAAASWVFLRATVRQPIRALTAGTEALARGDLDHVIAVRSNDDLGGLADSFNLMTRSLREAREENRRWAQTLEDRVRDKTAELQRLDRQILQIEKMTSLGTLAASVAHELNNPLSGILTYAKLQAKRVRRDHADAPWAPTLLGDLDMIAREAERCGGIVGNLLLFSRRQDGEFRRVSVRVVADRALTLLSHHLESRGVRVEVVCDPPDVELTGDEGQIEQALVALLINAADAMPSGGPVRVEARRAPDGGVRLRVADTGTGIAPADLPHVFEPFFTTKPLGQGVGLGLSVVYGIVQRHGATIEVASEPGQGATFTLSFPSPDRPAARRAAAAPDAP